MKDSSTRSGAGAGRASSTAATFSIVYSIPFLIGTAVLVLLVTLPYLFSSSAIRPHVLAIQQASEAAASAAAVAAAAASKPPAPSISAQEQARNSSKNRVDDCNLFDGEWIFDGRAPLYTHRSCRILSQAQDCQGNGRPDSEYELWRWSPRGCELLPLDPGALMQLLSNKTIAFVGDSVSRNQMESLMCILMQVEDPVNKGSRRMHRWIFPLHSLTVLRLWSSWLVRVEYGDPELPKDVAKLYLDEPDVALTEMLGVADIVLFGAGHWFSKTSAFIMGNKFVGSQGWKPTTTNEHWLNSLDAYSVAITTALNTVATRKQCKALVFLRTYSPDHYEGGTWNSGGSCSAHVGPLDAAAANASAHTGLNGAMYTAQRRAFEAAVKARAPGDGCRLRLLDVMPVSAFRADGHPGPYRGTTPAGQPQPSKAQDCLHWCMPGPIDAWNQLLYELLRRELRR